MCSQTQILFPGLIQWADEAPRFCQPCAEVPGEAAPVLAGNTGMGAGFTLPCHILQPAQRCVQWGDGSSLADEGTGESQGMVREK